MLGPQGISLLKKLGYKPAYEMTEAELLTLVEADRERRIKQRTLGRVLRQGAEPRTKGTKSARGKASAPAPEVSLDSLGLAPTIVAKLRAGGQSDKEIVQLLKRAGLIK